MAELMLGQDAQYPAGLGFAGDTLNTAVYLKRFLATPAETAFINVPGQDPLSGRMLSFIEAEAISTGRIRRSSDCLIGLYAIAADDTGEQMFNYWRNKSAARTLFQSTVGVEFTALSGFDVLCLSAITLGILQSHVRTLLIRAFDKLRREHNVKVVFDSNYRPTLWESVEQVQNNIADAWRVTDIALPFVDDDMALFNDSDEVAVLARLKSYGIIRDAMKCGVSGPWSLGEPGSNDTSCMTNMDTENITIVDMTAAGDSFNAGYLAATLNSANDQDAMSAGRQCSLRDIAHAGVIFT